MEKLCISVIRLIPCVYVCSWKLLTVGVFSYTHSRSDINPHNNNCANSITMNYSDDALCVLSALPVVSKCFSPPSERPLFDTLICSDQ